MQSSGTIPMGSPNMIAVSDSMVVSSSSSSDRLRSLMISATWYRPMLLDLSMEHPHVYDDSQHTHGNH